MRLGLRLLVAPVVAGVGVASAAPSATAAGPGAGGEFWRTAQRVVSTQKVFEASPVWLIGDSITVGTYGDLTAALTPAGVAVAVDATSGIPSVPATDRLVSRLKKTSNPPRVIVLALGSNDTVLDATSGRRIGHPQNVRASLKRVAAAAPRATIIVPEVYVKRVAANRYIRSHRVDVQAAELANSRTINREVARSGLATVVPWYDAMRRKGDVYLRDGVHTSPAGTAYRTGLLKRAVLKAL